MHMAYDVLSICFVVALRNVSGVKLLIPWHHVVPGKPERGTYVVLARNNGGDGAHIALERSRDAVTATTQKILRLCRAPAGSFELFLQSGYANQGFPSDFPDWLSF